MTVGCTTGGLPTGTATAVTIGTSLAVNLYPAAAPLVEMFAGGVRAATAKGPISPSDLAAYLSKYEADGVKFVAKVSPSLAAKAGTDVTRFVAAINKKYEEDYPRIQAGTLTVEEFAQAVEQGA